MAKQKIEVADISRLTDADWAKINKLSAIYETSGIKVLSKALDILRESDPVRRYRVMAAFLKTQWLRESSLSSSTENDKAPLRDRLTFRSWAFRGARKPS
jgi:hypothetical protein